METYLFYTKDNEEVWLLDNGEGYATFADEGEKPVCIEVHDFCRLCKENLENPELQFIICPTEKDSYVNTIENVLEDIEEELSLIE